MTRRSWAQAGTGRIGVAGVIVGLVLALVTPASAEARTRVIDLGTLPGRTVSAAVAISDTGFVTGSSTRPGTDDTRGFIWHPLLGMHDLGTLGGGHTRVTAVNRFGYVTGCSDSKDG